MSIRALIIDDEPLAQQSIRRFLKYHADIEVVGEYADGQSAVDAILANKPDLVFLDVQMPELDGFAVVNQVGAERMPATIFVTAYDQYALAAFDANALDYLLKPFGKTRFDRALARARERLALNADREVIQRFLETMGTSATTRNYVDRLATTENGRIVFVKTADIEWFESAGNHVRVHTRSRNHNVRDTLTHLESRLNPREFVRIHRSAIVNLQYVRELHPWFHGYHLVVLESGQRLRMSRYQKELAAKLGIGRQLI